MLHVLVNASIYKDMEAISDSKKRPTPPKAKDPRLRYEATSDSIKSQTDIAS